MRSGNDVGNPRGGGGGLDYISKALNCALHSKSRAGTHGGCYARPAPPPARPTHCGYFEVTVAVVVASMIILILVHLSLCFVLFGCVVLVWGSQLGVRCTDVSLSS